MLLFSGSSNGPLAQAVADRLGMRLARLLERFPDGELHVEIRDSVRGRR